MGPRAMTWARFCRLFLCAAPVVATSSSNQSWPGSCKSTDTADDVLRGMDLTGKVVIVTGADGNIAGEVCTALAKANATVLLACRSTPKCEALRQNIMLKVKSAARLEVGTLDLSSRANIAAFANRTMVAHPKIDVLVNSAGTYGTFITHDGLVAAMEINLLGPALLTHLLLPALRSAHGRVVNVAAATYGTALADNTTVADLAALCTRVDKTLNETGQYFSMSKFLMTHHAVELARRETRIAAFSLNPGVAVLDPSSRQRIPNWLKKAIVHHHYPNWLLNRLPPGVRRILTACNTNEVGLESCPETFDQGAGVVVAAAAWAGIENHSGVYLDFDTAPLPAGAPQVYGPFKQQEPTCTPREPPSMSPSLRTKWYDEMLRLMGVGAGESGAPLLDAVLI